VTAPLAHPRAREGSAFLKLVDEIYDVMTTPVPTAPVAQPAADRGSIAYRLPKASIESLGGLIERVASGPDYGRDDLPKLTEDMQLDVDDLFPLTDAAELLELAEVRSGDISILPAGQAFADGDIQQVLQTRPDHRAPQERFLSELQDFMSQEDAEAALATAIDWGRYAEVFAYDYNAGVLSLEAEPAPIGASPAAE
jgi:NitT/TauT family transport system ATP-binding protein